MSDNEQVEALKQLKDSLTAALTVCDPDAVLVRIEKEAATRLADAGLPATIAELRTVERFGKGEMDLRPAIVRITRDKTIPAHLRHCAEILSDADLLRQQIAQHGPQSAHAVADAARLIASFSAIVIAEDAPDVEMGRKNKAAREKAELERRRAAKARAVEFQAAFDEFKTTHPDKKYTALCDLVAAHCEADEKTVRLAVPNPNPRPRRPK